MPSLSRSVLLALLPVLATAGPVDKRQLSGLGGGYSGLGGGSSSLGGGDSSSGLGGILGGLGGSAGSDSSSGSSGGLGGLGNLGGLGGSSGGDSSSGSGGLGGLGDLGGLGGGSSGTIPGLGGLGGGSGGSTPSLPSITPGVTPYVPSTRSVEDSGIPADSSKKNKRAKAARQLSGLGSFGNLGGLGSSTGSSSGSSNGLGGLTSLGSTGGSTQNGLSGECKDVIIIFARGTSEMGNMGSVVGPGLYSSLEQKVGSGKVAAQGVDYAASAAGNAQMGDPAGSETMTKLIKQAFTKCPNAKVVISGYSQGAMLAHNAAKKVGADASKIAAVVTFGDPFKGQGFEGIDGSKCKVFCKTDDTVCGVANIGGLGGGSSSGVSTSGGTGGHMSYGNDVDAAAEFVVSAIGGASAST